MIRKTAPILALALTLALVGCGSSGGNIGDILGGGSPSSNSNYGTFRGVVQSVDLNSGSVILSNTGMSSSSGGTVRVYYDNRTTVNYNGRQYRPQDLERGDEVEVSATQNGNRLIADTMTVTYNAASNSGSYPNYPNGSYPSSTYPDNGTYGQTATIRGTVRNVDTSRQTIELEQTNWISSFDRSSGARATNVIVQYNGNMSIDVNGQSYPVSGLERGDVIEVQAQQNGSASNLFAQRITLVRDIRR